MSDWQVGDLALCIRDAGPEAGLPTIKRGQSKILAELFRGVPRPEETCDIGLVFVGQGDRFHGYEAVRFIKITPQSEDEFDREVIDLMAGKKVQA